MLHTKFSSDRFNRMIHAYNETGRLPPMPEAASIEELQARYVPTSKEDLRRTSQSFMADGHFKGSYVIATSGTTSEPLVLGHRIWEDVAEDTYPYQFFVYLITHVFSAEDVVVNLFTPGGLGVLYEGANRFLEPTGATILPIGLLQSIQSSDRYVSLFKELGVNTVMGAPSSVVQFAQTARAHRVDLDIRKVVYTGEHFFPTKKKLVSKIWPLTRYFSLFGAVEYGFAAVNTPEMPEGVHEILDDWYVLEVDEDDNVLLTDLTGPLIPVIRYRIGDKGRLVPPHADSSGAGLIIDGRSDASFNIAGNAISHETVRRAIEKAVGRSENLQIILDTDVEGRDLITVALDADLEAEPALSELALRGLVSINEIAEGINRSTVLSRVAGREALVKNWRTKTSDIIDCRVAPAPLRDT